jgi:hypothetical protein
MKTLKKTMLLVVCMLILVSPMAAYAGSSAPQVNHPQSTASDDSPHTLTRPSPDRGRSFKPTSSNCKIQMHPLCHSGPPRVRLP